MMFCPFVLCRLISSSRWTNRDREKYFHCSLGDISQHLEADGHCEVEAEHHTEDDYRTVHTVLLRLNISCKNKTNTTLGLSH